MSNARSESVEKERYDGLRRGVDKFKEQCAVEARKVLVNDEIEGHDIIGWGKGDPGAAIGEILVALPNGWNVVVVKELDHRDLNIARNSNPTAYERWSDRPSNKLIRSYTVIVANGDRVTLGRGGRISEGGIISEIARDSEGMREKIAAVVKKAAAYENRDACWFSKDESVEDSACWKLRGPMWCGEAETYGDLREVWVGIKVYYDDGTTGVVDPVACYPGLAIEFGCDPEKIEQINAMLGPGDPRRRVQVPGDKWLSDGELEMLQTHAPEIGL